MSFACLAAPLNEKWRKDQPKPFCLLDEKKWDGCFIKENLLSPPGLAFPKSKGRSKLYTEGYDKQIGLKVREEQYIGSKHSGSYWSSILTDIKRKLGMIYRAFQAVVWAIAIMSPFLKGAGFTTRTDHRAFPGSLTRAKATGKLEKWRLRLSEVKVDIFHRAGIKHQDAEALSRLKTKR